MLDDARSPYRHRFELVRASRRNRRSFGRARSIVGVLALAWAASGSATTEVRTDEWITGFATAALIREFEIMPRAVVADDGHLRVTVDELPTTAELDTVVRSLLDVPGVETVDLFLEAPGIEDPDLPIASGSDVDEVETLPAPEPGEDLRLELFPDSKLFAPIIADPRWPRFALSSTWYLDDPELGHVADVGFGVTFPLVRVPTESRGDFEFGIQGGVFSVFDFDADSFDLVNSDFIGGLFGSYHFAHASAMLRFYHQSSHLGDEYLLRNRIDRVNLSFEVLDLLLSYDFWTWLRVYGGGGVIVHREPAIDRGLLEVGAELESPKALLGGWLRPFAALDLQFREESDWKTDLSLGWGLKLEHPRLRRTPVALIAEYYRGRSPNGQFYVRRIETIGVGLQVDF